MYIGNCVVCLLLISANYAFTARILGVFHMPSYSHYSLGSTLMKALAEKGHDVTVISPYEEKEIPKGWKYREVVLSGFADKFEAMRRGLFSRAGSNPFVSSLVFHQKGADRADYVLSHPAVQKLIRSGEKYDIVLLEIFGNEAFAALARHFGASLVAFCSVGANSWINPLVGNPQPPSYVPDVLLGYPPKMNLWQRLYSSAYYTFTLLTRRWILTSKQNNLVQKYFPGFPHVDDLTGNISLVLLNSHPSIKQPVPLNPNMIEIGGFHVKPPEKLPDDLQKFLDDAKDGVIYFSMGSNLKSRDMPAEKREAILKVFSTLKEKVLWKWEEDILPGQPPNVKLGKWLPQQSILAHRNIKLFITHGGLLSTTETIYHGVPILALPIFGDQDANAETAVIYGYGEKLSFLELNEQTFSERINKVLNNPRYRENARKRSKILHDRPLKPLEAAVYWIEFVTRQGSGYQFRSPALDLAWYQYLLLDVTLIILSVTVIIVYAAKTIIKYFCCKQKNPKQKRH